MDDLTNSHISARAEIIAAAFDEIAEMKLSGTRMRSIAERAGISQGTLHYHFPTKADLLYALLEDMARIWDADRQRMLAAAEIPPREKLKLFSVQQKNVLREHANLQKVFIDFWGHAQTDPEIMPKIQWMYEVWRRDIRATLEEGVIQGEFDPAQLELAQYILVALLDGAAMQYLIDPDNLDLDAFFAVTDDIVLTLVSSAPPRDAYPTDLTDQQWPQITPLLPEAKPGGRPRSVSLREIVNAILYVTEVDCSWRMLPHDFPQWQTVYGYYKQWAEAGIIAAISEKLDQHIPLP